MGISTTGKCVGLPTRTSGHVGEKSTGEHHPFGVCRVGSPNTLHGWLTMIAREAMDMALLPGIQHSSISLEEVRKVWPGGVMCAGEAQFEELLDYPFNGLFAHPLNGGDHPAMRASSSAA